MSTSGYNLIVKFLHENTKEKHSIKNRQQHIIILATKERVGIVSA